MWRIQRSVKLHGALCLLACVAVLAEGGRLICMPPNAAEDLHTLLKADPTIDVVVLEGDMDLAPWSSLPPLTIGSNRTLEIRPKDDLRAK